MTKRIFITATDTDAGKTHIACAIVNALVKQEYKVSVFKPISAGCENIDGKLVNEDAQRLLAECNTGMTIEAVNPIAFEPPIAPHIAAEKLSQKIDLESVEQHYKSLLENKPDYIVTEGAGGWRLPLGNKRFLSELAVNTNQEVILVVNMKLGCLNHALLTYEAIIRDGLKCIGWVANCIEEMPYLTENLETLATLLPIPNIGTIGYEPDIENISRQIDTSVFKKSAERRFFIS